MRETITIIISLSVITVGAVGVSSFWLNERINDTQRDIAIVQTNIDDIKRSQAVT